MPNTKIITSILLNKHLAPIWPNILSQTGCNEWFICTTSNPLLNISSSWWVLVLHTKKWYFQKKNLWHNVKMSSRGTLKLKSSSVSRSIQCYVDLPLPYFSHHPFCIEVKKNISHFKSSNKMRVKVERKRKSVGICCLYLDTFVK